MHYLSLCSYLSGQTALAVIVVMNDSLARNRDLSLLNNQNIFAKCCSVYACSALDFEDVAIAEV